MFGSWFGNKASLPEGWIALEEESQLKEAVKQSFEKPVVLFKHSTRCGISSMAKERLVREWESNQDKYTFYYLDLLQFRNISNAIASNLRIQHESPQVIVLDQGRASRHLSHGEVDFSNF